MINVMIVDDQALVRNGLAMIVDSQDDLSVVAEADSGDSALILAKRLAVDVVLMDVCMPGTDGIETTSRLIESEPSPRVIIVTTFDIDKYVFGALRAGASGFIVKSAKAEDVIAAIRTVHAGDAVISPSSTRRLLAQVVPDLPGSVESPEVLDSLTPREEEVFIAVSSGASNTEIAQELFVSETTVKTHVGRLLHKLNARDRVQLAVLAYETGIVRPGHDRPRREYPSGG